jgi:hypothetical protein
MENEAVLKEWYERIQKHARANYSKGWDWVVECVGLEDFHRDVKEFDIASYEQLVEEYAERSELYAERDEEMRGISKDMGFDIW